MTELEAALPEVRRVLRKRMKDLEAADVAIQDAVVKAMENHHKFMPGSRMGSWFYIIARNQALDAKRRLAHSVPTDPTDRVFGEDQCSGGQEAAVDLARTVQRLRAMKPDFRDSLLCLVMGDTPQEAAERLGKSVGTVKSQGYRARKMLQGDDPYKQEYQKRKCTGDT